MKFWKHKTGRLLALLLAGGTLASCTAHSGNVPLSETGPFAPETLRRLLVDHPIYVHEQKGLPGGVSVRHVTPDGKWRGCGISAAGKTAWEASGEWSVGQDARGQATLFASVDGRPGRRLHVVHYDPGTGEIRIRAGRRSGKWMQTSWGWAQHELPQVAAEKCRKTDWSGLAVERRQTAGNLAELRQQAPDAPVVGDLSVSHQTTPGRTGLGASRGRPTTTRKEVWDYLRAQNGYVVTSPSETGYVLALGRDGVGHEVWELGADGEVETTGVLREEGDWVLIEVPDQSVLRYPVGYPVPLLPTGHRHPAFQLTGELVAEPKPTALAFMGEAYADNRFVFYGTGRLAVVDVAGDLIVEGSWRWTRGRLEIAVDGDTAGARSVGWRELADQLGKVPAVWKPASGTAG